MELGCRRAGAGPNGPQAPSAYSGLGYAFAQTNLVSVAAVSDQSGTERQGVHLTLDATDVNPSNSGFTWSQTGLPAGLVLNTATGVVSGTGRSARHGVYAVRRDRPDGLQRLQRPETFSGRSPRP